MGMSYYTTIQESEKESRELHTASVILMKHIYRMMWTNTESSQVTKSKTLWICRNIQL